MIQTEIAGAKKLYADTCITFVNEITEAAIMIKMCSVTGSELCPNGHHQKRNYAAEKSCIYTHRKKNILQDASMHA